MRTDTSTYPMFLLSLGPWLGSKISHAVRNTGYGLDLLPRGGIGTTQEYALFQASVAKSMSAAPFWAITQQIMVISYGRFNFKVSHPPCAAYNHKDRYSKSNTTGNILLLRSFIHIAYLRSNYMFRPFFLCHHQVDRISYNMHCTVAPNRIYDQPDDSIEKRPKHVVVPKIRYMNKAP